MTKKTLITASTFPRYLGDNTVDFVWQQARYLKKHYPDYEIHNFVPHNKGAKNYDVVEGIIIPRYAYFWLRNWQTLVYPAIWPNIKASPLRLLQVPSLLLCMYFAVRRDSALQLNIVSPFSYKIEALIQAGKKHMSVTSVPVETNEKTRESRLFSSIPKFIELELNKKQKPDRKDK